MTRTIITKTPRAVGVVPNLNFELTFFITELLIIIHTTAIITLLLTNQHERYAQSCFGVTVVLQASSSMKCQCSATAIAPAPANFGHCSLSVVG